MFTSNNSVLYKCVDVYFRVSDATSIHLFSFDVIPYFHLSVVDKFYINVEVSLEMI